MTQIAVLGLGIMGLGMARNLVASGHEVTVWNRTPRELHEDLTGASVAATIAEAVADQDRVLTCLTGPQAQRDVLLGDDGALANMAAVEIGPLRATQALVEAAVAMIAARTDSASKER